MTTSPALNTQVTHMNKQTKIIVIGGATACGKTDAAVNLALEIGGEIISADSMQVYRGMNIGTNKPSEAEMCGIKHYLIDEREPDEGFSVADFSELAAKYVDEITAKGKTPIICGGTGFYINALLRGNDFPDGGRDDDYRNELYSLAENQGNVALHELLRQNDSASAAVIDKNNVKRVVRALEFYKQTGTTISSHNALQRAKPPKYDAKIFLLGVDREKLYLRINSRVDEMVKHGLFEEVAELLEKGYSRSLTSMQGIGYKEVAEYLAGELSKDECIEKIKRGTRHYAKRQMTWFSRQIDNSIWLDVTNAASAENITNMYINVPESTGGEIT